MTLKERNMFEQLQKVKDSYDSSLYKALITEELL